MTEPTPAAATLPYSSRPAPNVEPLPLDGEDYGRIARGVRVLRGCAGALVGLGWALIGLGILSVIGGLGAWDKAAGWGERLQIFLGSLRPLIEGVVLIVIATFLGMQAAVATAVRELARTVLGNLGV